MKPIWTEGVSMPCFPPLWGETRTDVLIIGGGMTGLLCAHQLQQAGIRCVVAEASAIASGVTRGTTAKITSQHGLIYHQLLKRFGVERRRCIGKPMSRPCRPFAPFAPGSTATLRNRIVLFTPPATGRSWKPNWRHSKPSAAGRTSPRICRFPSLPWARCGFPARRSFTR